MKKTSTLALLFAVTVSSFIGCKKSDNPISYTAETEKTTHFDQKIQLSVSPSNDGFTYTAQDTTVGKVASDGTYTPYVIGKRTVTATKGTTSFTFNINVLPYETFIKEPILDFTLTKEQLKTKETRTLVYETNDVIFYEDKSQSFVKNIGYIFKNNIVSSALVVVDVSNPNYIKKSLTYYSERYRAFEINSSNYTANFFSTDKKIGINLTGKSSDKTVHIIYIPLK